MYLFFRKLVEIYTKIRFRTNVHGKENIPKDSVKGGFIVACNHQFYSDPPTVAAFIRGRFSFMAKSELFKNKAMAWLIRCCGAFPVVRGANDDSAIERAVSDLKSGKIFVIFPEGTRSKDGKIARGRSGISIIASMSGAPVLPVCIMYGLKGKKNRLDFAVGKMIPAEEIKLSADSAEYRKDLKRVTERIMGSIKQLQQEIFINTGTLGDNLKKAENDTH